MLVAVFSQVQIEIGMNVYADDFVATSGATYSRMAGKNPQVNLTRDLVEISELKELVNKLTSKKE